MKKDIPIVNKTYYFYEGGIISKTSQKSVVVTEVLTNMQYKKKYSEEFKIWLSEKKLFDYRYRDTTDYFVNAVNKDDSEEIFTFVRSKKKHLQWFSFGGFLTEGVLDVTNELTNELNERIKRINNSDKDCDMFITKIIRSLIFSFIRDVKSMIGTLAIIIVLYLGFFGSEKYNVKPFLLKLFSSESSKEIVKKTVQKQITNL